MMSEGSGVAKVTEHSNRSFFDRFAGRCSAFVSRAPFFTFCVLVVLLWAPTYFLLGNFDTYQLIINPPTTIITFFLLVALLQNTHKRNEQALQHKLNAVADGPLQTLWSTSQKTILSGGLPRRTFRATSRTLGPR
jgi:hypothetical protein